MLFYTRSQEIKDNLCREIQNLNGVWKVQISKPGRTLPQNAYFHALLAEIAPHTPYPPQELKEILKSEWLGVQETEWRGKKYTLPIPSSSLDTKQYAYLLEKLLMLASELGVEPKGAKFYGIRES